MDSLEQDYVKKRKIYRDIFKKSQESIDKQILDLKKFYLCTRCKDECEFKDNSSSVFLDYPSGCSYKNWQSATIELLQNQISKDILVKIRQVLAYKESFSCSRCALCCKFACSEFSYEELKQKAASGDKFASQFTSVFVPYEDIAVPYQVYGDYIELLKSKYGTLDGVHFYYCPKLSSDNLCTDYENRPDICKDFPTNALAILPNSCGFKTWKDEMEIVSLMLHSLSEIVGFYLEKLESSK